MSEKEYYIEFTRHNYDYIWAESEEDAKNNIFEIYGYVDITLIEEYKNDMPEIVSGIAND